MNINNITYKDNLNYDNNLNYKEIVIARNEMMWQSHKATNITRLPRYAHNDDIYCNKSILNLNNNLTPNPRPLPLMFTLLNSHFAERQATEIVQAHFGSASCFLLVSLASALRQTFASLTGDVMQAYIPLPSCFKGEGEFALSTKFNFQFSIFHFQFLKINPPVSKADIPPYKGGRCGAYYLTRLLRLWLAMTNYCKRVFASLTKFNCKSIIFNFPFSIFNFSKSAFSLIELSIVLIIIGLLIAGVTGGASLIQSAKVRSLINEIKDYERAVYTFQAARGRYPGDVENYGTFGHYSNYSNNSSSAKPYRAYKASDFPSDFLTEFRKTAGTSAIPDYDSAHFVELYTEGIIDFKPLGNNPTPDKSNTKKATPNSKVINNDSVYIRFYHTGTLPFFSDAPSNDGYYLNGIARFGSAKEMLFYYFPKATATKGMDPQILKQVDIKMDDGENWNGRIRTSCFGKNSSGGVSDTTDGYADYDYAIENGKKCNYIHYAI